MAATERLTADAGGLARAAALLAAGRTVAFPTDTVYGLGADARSDAAVAAIYAAKDRPRFNPLIVHLPEAAAVRELAIAGPAAERLMAAFWPGPLTLVLPLRPDAGISALVTAGHDSVALRVPGSALARRLIAAAGCPVAGPSANPSGRISPTSAAHVLAGLDGRIAAVLDGGPCPVGVESTILDLTDDDAPVLLRPGGLAAERVSEVLGAMPAAAPNHDANAPKAPGQLASHYAPRAAVRLNATEARAGETLVGFGPTPGAALNLSPSGDLAEAAAALFEILHRLDEAGAIAIAPIPDQGLGAAINDRLRRAAAPRG